MNLPVPFPHASYIVTAVTTLGEREPITFLRDTHKPHLLTGTYTTPCGTAVDILLEGTDETPGGTVIQSASHHGPFHFKINAGCVPQSLPLTYIKSNHTLVLLLVPLHHGTPEVPAHEIIGAIECAPKTNAELEGELRKMYNTLARDYHHLALDCTPAGKYPPKEHRVYFTVDALFADPVWRKSMHLDEYASESA